MCKSSTAGVYTHASSAILLCLAISAHLVPIELPCVLLAMWYVLRRYALGVGLLCVGIVFFNAPLVAMIIVFLVWHGMTVRLCLKRCDSTQVVAHGMRSVSGDPQTSVPYFHH